MKSKNYQRRAKPIIEDPADFDALMKILDFANYLSMQEALRGVLVENKTMVFICEKHGLQYSKLRWAAKRLQKFYTNYRVAMTGKRSGLNSNSTHL